VVTVGAAAAPGELASLISALVPQVEAVFRTVRMRRLTQRIRKGRTDVLG
jgi:hypothetical protein